MNRLTKKPGFWFTGQYIDKLPVTGAPHVHKKTGKVSCCDELLLGNLSPWMMTIRYEIIKITK